MVMAGGRWLGVRLDVIISVLIGTVALAAVLASQEVAVFRIIIPKKNHLRPYEIISKEDSQRKSP